MYITPATDALAIATMLAYISQGEDDAGKEEEEQIGSGERRSNSISLSASISSVFGKLFNCIPRPRRATLRRLGNSAVKEAVERYESERFPGPAPRFD